MHRFPPAENQFVVPPLGGSLRRHGIGLHPTLPPKSGTTNFHPRSTVSLFLPAGACYHPARPGGLSRFRRRLADLNADGIPGVAHGPLLDAVGAVEFPSDVEGGFGAILEDRRRAQSVSQRDIPDPPGALPGIASEADGQLV